MYTTTNFQTKKALKDALSAGTPVQVYQPGPYNQGPVQQGIYAVEGPHYPQPHRWYARVKVENYLVTKILS